MANQLDISRFDLIDLLEAQVITPDQLAKLVAKPLPLPWWRRLFTRRAK